jgi:hypothetical protein
MLRAGAGAELQYTCPGGRLDEDPFEAASRSRRAFITEFSATPTARPMVLAGT